MRVLADFHHHALAESLLILFEDTYRADVYFPIGMDWFHEGVWQFEKAFHGDRVARQYLEGIWVDAVEEQPGFWSRKDPRHPGRVHLGITLEAARALDWDVVLSTLPPNDPGFHQLAKRSGAAFGVQVGNNHQVSSWHLADFILSSSTLPAEGYVKPDTWGRRVSFMGKPTIIYHQAFSLETFRHEYPPASRRTVASFVNCFPEGPSYPDFLAFARSHAINLDLDLRVYGAIGQPSWSPMVPYRDEYAAGDLSSVPAIGDAMRAAGVIWHTKHWSDGFGHVIHNAFAVGRPVIGYQRYYADKLAGPLWDEGVTSFNIEGLSHGDLAALLGRLCHGDPAEHERMSHAAAQRFRELVHLDREAEAIGELLADVTHKPWVKA